MRRWRHLPFRRGQFTWVPSAAQQPAPPAFVPQFPRPAGRRVVRPARGRFTTVPQVLGLPPAGVTRRRPQFPLPRRGRFTAVPPAPPAAPPAWCPGVTRPSVRRLARPRRGRFAEPASPPQAPPPPPVFTVGALSASAAAATQASTDVAVSALTARTAPSGALTAGTTRTGGPS